MALHTINVHEVKNRAHANGSHFFDDDTMRFFKSIISETAYQSCDEDIYFVTSEKPPYGPREYKLRLSTVRGQIDTIETYPTLKQAHRNALIMAAGGLLLDHDATYMMSDSARVLERGKREVEMIISALDALPKRDAKRIVRDILRDHPCADYFDFRIKDYAG